jgi:hypothetical protein
MKRKMKRRGKGWRMGTINIPALLYSVHVVVTNDFEGTMRILNLQNDGNFTGCEAITATPDPNDNGESYIFLRDKKKNNAQIVDDIAHESWHAVNQMFEFVEADLENEMVAYHLGYIARHAYDIWKNGK